jgi:hypothetical protein
MLGPVEDLLATSHTGLSPADKGQLEIVNSNGMRLLRLVIVEIYVIFAHIARKSAGRFFNRQTLLVYLRAASVFRTVTDERG